MQTGAQRARAKPASFAPGLDPVGCECWEADQMKEDSMTNAGMEQQVTLTPRLLILRSARR